MLIIFISGFVFYSSYELFPFGYFHSSFLILFDEQILVIYFVDLVMESYASMRDFELVNAMLI
ncbi:hypothetical protein, partial [Bacillus spizizenii]|uniref:hypothetical protein n=1 Tax=Bacillus spizizenii TaxID=96241 RepID=UPI001F625F4E